MTLKRFGGDLTLKTTPPLSPKAARLYQAERTAYRTWIQKTSRENFDAWNTAKAKLAEAVKNERKSGSPTKPDWTAEEILRREG